MENVHKTIDEFLKYHKNRLLSIAKNCPKIKTLQGLLEKDWKIIKEMKLITKCSLQHMFQADVNIVYNIEKKRNNIR